MGQQQLLLIILTAVIVGIAVTVGINMFGEGAYQANRDAVLTDAATIASRAQGWYRKPGVLGGGDRSFDGLSDLSTIGFPDTTANGNFAISGSGQSATITAEGTEDSDNNGSPLKFTMTVHPDSVGTPAFSED